MGCSLLEEYRGTIERNCQRNRGGKTRRSKVLVLARFAIIAVIAIILLVCLALSPLFCIKSIEVGGNKRYNDNEIIEAANLQMGDNWFKSADIKMKNMDIFRSVGAEELLLKRCPYLETAAVRLRLPTRVKITVTERKPAVLIPYFGTNLVIDSNNYVIDTIGDAEGSSIPIARGITCNGYTLGQALETEKPEGITALDTVLKTISSSDLNAGDRDKEFDILDSMTYIDVSDLENIHICLDSRIIINLGDYKKINEYRIDFLREIYYLQLKRDDKGFLDFTSGEYPSFIPN
ncbi:MAG: FtsQ-type POTRA domain-containing protein [Clostridium sp.]|nr:FtsQ-type POTRA domain-containing protein [Clostridium sp.]